MSVVLLAGASARAAAASALRAGLSPWCVDLFADADLARACPVMKLPIDRYPHGFLDALAEGPPGPWQYTGGLENHPDLIDAIPRQLLGNSGNVVRAVRGALTTIFGPTAPRECHAGTPSPTVTWLSKPRRGSGGLGVRRWQPGDPFDARTHFLQEFIEGVACSAVYVDDRFLGATRQLIGPSWVRAPRPFQYAGSIGPLPLSDANDATLRSWGDCLVKKFHLRGIFGVDFMLTPTGCRPIEVNPRYPASTEILERRFSPRPLYSGGEGLGVRGSESHARDESSARYPSPELGCAEKAAESPGTAVPGLSASIYGRERELVFGKAILYAERDIVFPEDGPWMHSLPLEDLRVPFADIPHPGTKIARGDPILTLFGEGDSFEECETMLRWNVDSVAHQLY